METFTSAALALLALLLKDNPQEFKDSVQTRSKLNLLEKYDFIIVGAGSAGSSLANRLSEVEDWNVLLIEAGGQEDALTRTPSMHTILKNTRYDWNYTTIPQKRTCKAVNGRCQYPRGYVLGGSSSINAMTYIRGYRSDYDKWGSDNCGWSFKDVEPYFKQMETNTITGMDNHGKKGPMTVGYPPYATLIRDDVIKAGEAIGMKNTDCPDYEGDCIYAVQSNIKDGKRWSVSTAYLEPITAKRDNLHVVTNCHVAKVIIENGKAKGVRLSNGGEGMNVYSDKEVILSAGSINSPQILMLSGIGPKEHLKSLEIDAIVDLPVGDNFQDQTSVSMWFETKNGSAPTVETMADSEIQEQYVQHQQGPFSYPGTEVLGFYKTGSENQLEPPNIQYHIRTLSQTLVPTVEILTTNVRPTSRGTVRLNSTNHLDHPLIDVNYYDDHRDWEMTMEGMKFGYQLLQMEPLSRYNLTMIKTMQPLCMNKEMKTYLDCLIEYYSGTLFHPMGTAKMGFREKNGVVDNKLRVYGVEGLRVIDASIAPTIISMNSNAMAIMIGEKGADLIKATYGKSTLQNVNPCKK